MNEPWRAPIFSTDVCAEGRHNECPGEGFVPDGAKLPCRCCQQGHPEPGLALAWECRCGKKSKLTWSRAVIGIGRGFPYRRAKNALKNHEKDAGHRGWGRVVAVRIPSGRAVEADAVAA